MIFDEIFPGFPPAIHISISHSQFQLRSVYFSLSLSLSPFVCLLWLLSLIKHTNILPRTCCCSFPLSHPLPIPRPVVVTVVTVSGIASLSLKVSVLFRVRVSQVANSFSL